MLFLISQIAKQKLNLRVIYKQLSVGGLIAAFYLGKENKFILLDTYCPTRILL